MRYTSFVISLFVIATLFSCGSADTPNEDQVISSSNIAPWDDPQAPPTGAYSGPLFTLSHDFPPNPVSPPETPPWQAAIDFDPIDVTNSEAYVEALKDYIAEDMQTLLFDYESWNPATAGWYNLPWLSGIREPIHGTYQGSPFPAGMFPQSGLQEDMTTHVLVYYDEVAASSLQGIWGASGMDPVPGIESEMAQFPEGSIIVKPAFTTAGGDVWPPIEGAFPWEIWDATNSAIQDVYLFQFDIIVKDSESAPDTGWVFSTLIYDGSIQSSDPWDKMVPLGAMWGNDPNVISPQGCDYLTPGSCPTLSQTWINETTPVYARETLGWGGRLSGPNDGAVDISAYVDTPNGPEPYDGRYAMSSCMSCHSSAEYEMQSFLLPSPATCKNDQCAPTIEKNSIVYYESGSPEFMKWFQSPPGYVPINEGQIALDYGMNLAFKSLPAWFKETNQTGKLNFVETPIDYRGHPSSSE